MKKKLFLALLTTLLLLLAATTALAVSPSDYNCLVCGEPCTEWYSYFNQDGTASLHSPACYICYTFVWDTEFLCTPAEGTATCILPAVCSVCGDLDWAGSAPDPNAHGDMSRWINTSPTQHYRYCLDCVAEASYEYEDHYGGTATCSKRAICEGCGGSYGELSTEHAMSEWKSISTTQHRKYCTLCWAVETIIYEDHYGGTATCWELAVCEGCGEPYGDYDFDNHDWGDWEGFSASTHIRVCLDCDAEEEAPHTGGDGSCFPICEVCGWYYIDPDGEHRNMCDWFPVSDTQHRRYCTDCNAYESNEYEDHYGGTATCTQRAVCEGCGTEYGEYSDVHPWGEWEYLDDTSHQRPCTNPDCHVSDCTDHSGGDGSCWTECADCGNHYYNAEGQHLTMSVWYYLDGAQHMRHCVDCGYGEQYEDHTGGTATCSELAVCEVCGEDYGELAANAHSWGEWTPNADGTHTRVCALNAEHTETADCTWGDWTHLTHIHHERRCTVCNAQELGEHTGGTLTCYSPRICDVCNEGYGSPDNSGLSGHPNPVIEQKPGTCYDEGYYRITCDHPGCSMPFFEIILPANGQHLYNHWDILGDNMHHTDCAQCGENTDVACTLWELYEGETLLTVCPVCGDFAEALFEVLLARDDAAVPIGTLLVRGLADPIDGALFGFTVAGVYGGEVVDIHGPVTITIPVECEGFTVVRVEIVDDAEVRTEIPFTLNNGHLTIETATAGLFLLVPAE